MIIKVARYSDGWRAYFEHDRAKWAHGKTQAEAVGTLLSLFGNEIGLRFEHEITEAA